MRFKKTTAPTPGAGHDDLRAGFLTVRCDTARMKFVLVLTLTLAPFWVKCALNPRSVEKELRKPEEEEEFGESSFTVLTVVSF